MTRFISYLLVLIVSMAPCFIRDTAIIWAKPADVEILKVGQIDLDGDNLPDETVIDCSFYTSHDQVLVFDGKRDMHIGTNWNQTTDFTNDTWVFDSGADGTAQLIIKFHQENGQLVAYLYFDEDGDGKVKFDIKVKELKILEGKTPSLRVASNNNWLSNDGKPNQNIKFYRSDAPEFFSEIVDKNQDSVPDFEAWNLFLSPPDESEETSVSSGLWENKSINVPKSLGNTIFWPFLVGSEHLNELKKENKFSYFPFVSVNWKKAKLEDISVGKTTSGYPIESGYFILSTRNLAVGQSNQANFENPMAYYDLANDHDGQPELHIRLEHYDPYDPYLDVGLSTTPLNDIRYSWNQDNSPDSVWDYKVALAGINPVTTSAQFDNFSIQTVPYEQLPKWVNDNRWEWGTLVANEGGGYPSSEGIYEWSATNEFQADSSDTNSIIKGSQWEIRNYLTGLSNIPPDRLYQNIRTGLRGEFGYLGDKPVLYFSPIDAKLHLRKAIQGVWNLGDGQEIRYANLDGDAYLDQWQKQDDGVLVQQLNYCQGILLYSGNDRFRLKQVNTPPALFDTQPPGTYNEYMSLGKKLDANKANFSLDDLETMLEQYGDADVSIQGASLRDFRITQGGFRFILKLQKGFRFQGEDRLGVNGKSPGEYVVRYDGTFHLQPLTPPSLQIQFLQKSSENSTSTYLSTNLQIVLSNTGSEDAHQVRISLGSAQPGHTIEWAEPQIVTVFAGENTAISIPWVPTSPGAWEVLAKAEIVDSGSPAVTARQTINAAPAQGTTLQQDLTAFGLITPAQGIALMMTVITLGGFTGWLLVQYLKKDAGGNTN